MQLRGTIKVNLIVTACTVVRVLAMTLTKTPNRPCAHLVTGPLAGAALPRVSELLLLVVHARFASSTGCRTHLESVDLGEEVWILTRMEMQRS